MFEAKLQTFTESADGSKGAARVAALRKACAGFALDGFIIPRADEHQGEYVPTCDERLAWLTGFTGSAGAAIVLGQTAAIFIDGRYTEQAAVQTDAAVFERVPSFAVSLSDWLAANAPANAQIGYDPALHTVHEIERLGKAIAPAGLSLVPVATNPIDTLWTDRPPPPSGRIVAHPLSFAGETTESKLVRIRAAMAKERLDLLVISDPHALAWTFNIRGDDVSYTPLPLGYALIPLTARPELLVAPAKLSADLSDSLSALADLHAPGQLQARLSALSPAKRVRLDAASAGIRLKTWIEAAGGIADVGLDPTALMKAAKNAAEQAGTRAAHLRDGAAMAEFLCWFDAEAPKGKLTEIDAVAALETFRRATGKLKNLSFPSISGANAHAALPHYRVSTASNAPISPGVFLIDSGGQYEDGTTDITRTIAVGPPAADLKDRYTRVLKGMIAISRAVFPQGTSGAQLDTLARQALWQIGADFEHGTGHGVGSYLSVHEGPQRISKLGTTPLQPGMIVSNEPGYYRPGAFGIRIENLVMVQPVEIAGAERTMFGFETISFAPIDKRMIVKDLLDASETDWLNNYHREVRIRLTPLVSPATAAWLEVATAPI